MSALLALVLFSAAAVGRGERQHGFNLAGLATSEEKALLEDSFLAHFVPACLAAEHVNSHQGGNPNIVEKAACSDWSKKPYFKAGVRSFDARIKTMCEESGDSVRHAKFDKLCTEAKAELGDERLSVMKDFFGKIMEQVFSSVSDLPSSSPVAIIAMGPPASGKSKGSIGEAFGQLSAPMKSLGLELSNFAEYNIDKAVTVDDRYAAEVKFRQHLSASFKELKGALQPQGGDDEGAVGAGAVRLTSKYIKQLSGLLFGAGDYKSYRNSDYNRIRVEDHVDDVNNGALVAAMAHGWPLIYETTFSNPWFLEVDAPKLKLAGYRIEGYYPLVPMDEMIRRAKVRGEETGRTVSGQQIRADTERAAEQLVKVLEGSEQGFDAVTVVTRYAPDGSIKRGGQGKVVLQFDGARQCATACADEATFKAFDVIGLAACRGLPKC